LNEVLEGVSVPSGSVNNSVQYSYTQTFNTTILGFVLYPCFGNLEWYLSLTSPAVNKDKSTCYNMLNKGDTEDSCGPLTLVTAPTTYFIQVNGFNSWVTHPWQSAKFDMLVYNNVTLFGNIIPEPGSDGSLTPSITKSSSTNDPINITFSWTTTGVEGDSYSVYQYQGPNPLLAGYYPYTACGVREYMKLLNSSTDYELSTSGSTMTAKLVNYPQKTEYHIGVVVSRPGGYSVAYQPLVINGGTGIIPSMILVICVLILMLLN